MPRFYFDLDNGDGLVRDQEGIELGDATEARDVAVRSARDVAASEIREGRGVSLSSFIAIRDGAASEIARVTFAEALRITP